LIIAKRKSFSGEKKEPNDNSFEESENDRRRQGEQEERGEAKHQTIE
jgi:hypothetical protein